MSRHRLFQQLFQSPHHRKQNSSVERLQSLHESLLQSVLLQPNDEDSNNHHEASTNDADPEEKKKDDDNDYDDDETDVPVTAIVKRQFVLTLTKQFHQRRNSNMKPHHHHHHDGPNGTKHKTSRGTRQRQRYLSAAFRQFIVESHSSDYDSDTERSGSTTITTTTPSSLTFETMVTSLEQSVVETIRSIGDEVIQAENDDDHHHPPHHHHHPPPSSLSSWSPTRLRSDPTFEYFCDTDILALLVDIAKEKPHTDGNAATIVSSDDDEDDDEHDCLPPTHATTTTTTTTFHGIVWSAAVKAQVFQTVSLLLSSVQDLSTLYYLLSRNYVNELVHSILPLQQWTDQALERMLLPYIDLLKNLTLQLRASPSLFACLVVMEEEHVVEVDEENRSEAETGSTSLFPLFTAALSTAQSAYAHSHSFAHVTCLNLMVSLLQMEPVHAWFMQGTMQQQQQQRILSHHIAQLVLDTYQRMSALTTGPVVNTVRATAMARQIAGWQDQIDLINDLLECHVLGLNVCLCEVLLQRVMATFLSAWLPSSRTANRALLVVGQVDADVIPEPEAHAQVSTMMTSIWVDSLNYAPLLRMLTVALFHPWSTVEWERTITTAPDYDDITEWSHGDFVLTKALHSIVERNNKTDRDKQKNDDDDNGDTECSVVPNLYCEEIVKAIRGQYGEWRLCASMRLLESVLRSKTIDAKTLQSVEIVSRCVSQNDKEFHASRFEVAVADFLNRRHTLTSSTSITALECAASLAVELIRQSVVASHGAGESTWSVAAMRTSPLWRALEQTRKYFFQKVLADCERLAVGEVYVDVMEAAIQAKYHLVTAQSGIPTGFALHFSHCPVTKATSSEFLIRKDRGVSGTEPEVTRFHAQMALHFRAVCEELQHFQDAMETVNEKSNLHMLRSHSADDEILRLGSLLVSSHRGKEIDLRGCMAFSCFSGSCEELSQQSVLNAHLGSHLVVALDPTNMYIAHASNIGKIRSKLICSIALRNVIATAADEEWLHVAVRHNDIPLLIKNGNMALRFETSGKCLIARQHISRYRKIVREELMATCQTMFQECEEVGPSSAQEPRVSGEETVQPV